ncbi:hypothetical protein SCP_0116910 [Sparassis crispa]|uniref:Uncharacterized protein n=1 Tax=Sparassis crispa TaxID=139825 RepID=A0A401G9G4_9APHY|nr:hypothetical protein SCP_0116910 [Sparassis crispa]GBE78798.1 hypothetical protein SCP_0116910 [Sparassis crispa]
MEKDGGGAVVLAAPREQESRPCVRVDIARWDALAGHSACIASSRGWGRRRRGELVGRGASPSTTRAGGVLLRTPRAWPADADGTAALAGSATALVRAWTTRAKGDGGVDESGTAVVPPRRPRAPVCSCWVRAACLPGRGRLHRQERDGGGGLLARTRTAVDRLQTAGFKWGEGR